MGVLTDGRMQFTPFHVETDTDLHEIRSGLETADGEGWDTKYWSVIREEPNMLRQPGVDIPSLSVPYVEATGDGLPERLSLRCYWWSLNKKLLTVPGVDTDALYQLDAVDIVMYRPDENIIRGVVSTRTTSTLNRDIKPILNAIFGQDGKVPTINFGPPKDEGIPEDFFLWLLYRAHSNEEITTDLYLSEVSEVTGSDPRHRRSILGDSATMDRAELLALLIGGTTRFGPAKVGLEHEPTSLICTVKLHPDSGFDIINGTSRYRGEKNSQIPEGALYRESIFTDIYYKIIPELLHAYHADNHWRDSGKSEFIKMSQSLLATVLQEILGRQSSEPDES